MALSNVGPVAIVRPGWLCASTSAAAGERISWRFEGGREGCGETMAVGVMGARFECRLDETWPGVGTDGEGVVEVEEASRISRAVRVSEVGVARAGLLWVGIGVQWEL